MKYLSSNRSNPGIDGVRSTLTLAQRHGLRDDPVSAVLKWILLFLALGCLGMIIWASTVTFHGAPPEGVNLIAPNGQALLSKTSIIAGKAGFQKADLMDYGSLYGVGSYFGEDYTATNLVELATKTEDNLAVAAFGKPFTKLTAAQQAPLNLQMQKELRGLDLTSGTVRVPAAFAAAIADLKENIAKHLLLNDYVAGYSRARSLDPATASATAEFLIYSSILTVADRPHSTISWTQNWPYEPLVGNTPTTMTSMWTWASFCFVFFLFGGVLFIYQIFVSGDDKDLMDPILLDLPPLTLSQRKTGKYFLFVAAMLLIQIGAGSVLAHYYTDRTSFYGIPVGKFLPYNFLRDVHIQSALVWILFSWIGAGLFLAPTISGTEAKGQGKMVDLLFWTSIIVVIGLLAGDYLGIMGFIRQGWFWFGNQGLAYLELGRFWQIIFFIGLATWCVLMARALWPTPALLRGSLRNFVSGHIRIENLLWISTANVVVLYAFGMVPLTGIEKSFTIQEYWRFWVVHLWVEQSFEFFAACMSAYLLMGLGLVSRKLAERAMYFEVILIFLGGVLGTGHHLYWNGSPSMWIPYGSMFSFIEVLPLVLLILDGVSEYRTIKATQNFKYRLAYMYILGAAFWNFVGAGVFGGGTLNAPLVNYYEHGTYLTLNHAHTALFGAFGLLGIGLIYFCLRAIAGERFVFSEKLGVFAFWLYNAGLVLWILFNFFPVGWEQLAAVYEHGYAYARSMAFYKTVAIWLWLRLPGDIVFAAGAVLMAIDFIIKLRPVYPAWTPESR